MELIHERLAAELKRLNLSAAQAARDAGLADSQGLRDVLNGRKRLSAELLGALVKHCGVDAGFVLGDDTKAKLEQAQALAAAPGIGAAALLQDLLCVQEPAGVYSTVELSAAEAKLVASWRSCGSLDQQTLVVLAQRLARVPAEEGDR